jgi:hypothetical protein
MASPDDKPQVVIINLWERCIDTCCMCGQPALNRWGIPVDSETALIVGNDFQGEWGSKGCCESCYNRHQAGEFVGEYPRF